MRPIPPGSVLSGPRVALLPPPLLLLLLVAAAGSAQAQAPAPDLAALCRWVSRVVAAAAPGGAGTRAPPLVAVRSLGFVWLRGRERPSEVAGGRATAGLLSHRSLS